MKKTSTNGKPPVKRGPRELPLHQWCINEVTVQGILSLPATVTIEEIHFDIGFALKRIATTIPPALRECGVTYLRENSPSMEAQGTLTGTRSVIIRNAKEICRVLHLEYERMRVRRMKVSYQGTTVVFTAMTKKLPDKEGSSGDLKRHKVLGLVLPVEKQEDAGVIRLVKALLADRIECHYSVQPVRTVICSR